ncbi:MAG: ribose ABC transporter permease, partial [Solibacillus sp.]
MLKTSSKEMLGKLGPLLGLFLIVIVITILNPSFMTTDNILNILRQVSISALIAFGMTFVILTGGIDLSVGSTLALTGAVAATMLASGIDPVLTILAALLLGAILGAVNGVIIAKGKVAPFIATLATM